MAFLCTSCGLKESRCKCDRFCVLCKSDYNVRLCQDGCYYCADCREVCEFQAEELEYDD